MAETDGPSVFDEQMQRIYFITGTRTQIELANFLGLRQSAVSVAKRRENIPSDWLVILMRVKNIHPEWILTGKGPCFIGTAPERRYETGEEAVERTADEDALRRLSARKLADELVRRIVVSQADSYSRGLVFPKM